MDIKKARVRLLVPRYQGLRIALIGRTSNAEAHAL